jgi:hypothetical protein
MLSRNFLGDRRRFACRGGRFRGLARAALIAPRRFFALRLRRACRRVVTCA